MRRIPQKWKIVCLLFAIGALNYGDRTAIASVFPLLRADLGISDVVMAGLGSVFLWSYAVGSPIAGYVADRLSRSRVVLVSLLAWSAVMFATGFVNSAPMLLVTRALLGIAECAYLPASIALIAEHHGPESRGTAIGIQTAGLNIGLIGGSAIAGYLGERFGWRIDFLVLGGAGLLLGLVAMFVLRDGPGAADRRKDTSERVSVVQLLRVPGYVPVVAGAMLISVGTWIFLNWMPLYLHDRFHLGLAAAGLSSSSMLQVAAIAGVLVGGRISDRVARRWPGKRILFLGICYLLAAPFLLIFLTPAPLAAIIPSIFLYSFGRSVGGASECPIICEAAGPRLSSTGLGILNMMNCLAGGIGIIWASFLKGHFGWGVSFGSVSATVVLAGVVVLLGYFAAGRRDRRMAEGGLEMGSTLVNQ